MSLTVYFLLFSKTVMFLIPQFGRFLIQRTLALAHRWTWRDVPEAKNVVVIGGSFAGVQVVNHLADTLPTGYKVVLIEKNSHLHYVFNFPRFSVLSGLERTAFIPYDGMASSAPAGIVTRIQDTASGLTFNEVVLASGGRIRYAYLVIASGSSQPYPVSLESTEREEACRELKDMQGAIQRSKKIAIVGGGAAGVELASDIKDFYPDKDVKLIHSRSRLLSHFGTRLQTYVEASLRNGLGVEILLNERPKMSITDENVGTTSLAFPDSRREEFDLVVSILR